MMTAEQLKPLSLSMLLDGIAPMSEDEDLVPEHLSLDSRQIAEGGLFLACRGSGGHHGLDHVEQAVAQGAVALFWEPAADRKPPALDIPVIAVPELSRQAGRIAARFYGDPSRHLRVIGVTGTNGKTSIAHVLASALDAEGRGAGLAGTLGVGRPGQLAPVRHTTADAVTLQAQLADLQQSGARYAAIEVSSHGLAQHRVSAVRFRGAVFSNLSHDHLDYHGSESAYAHAKRRLFEHPELQWAVINADDYWGEHMAGALERSVRALWISEQPLAGQSGDALRHQPVLGSDGMTLSISGALGEATIHSKWLGRFNGFNLAAAFAALRLEGLSCKAAVQALASVPPVPGRMERFGGGRRPMVVVDYAHTPDALSQALQSLREHTRGRLWCLFGCGGERDQAKRPLMGRIAVRLADEVIITDDNPRGEPGEQIVADILRGAGRDARVCRNRAEAMEQAVTRARPGDVILVAGKGHEEEQLVADQRIRFSDRDWARHLVGPGNGEEGA
ncbi:UDP-N-acetylmuramoyl-L-alanyl-D-glutamate--2,6-diaminopimelate ligase [Natronospira proteinivora]|uniref:UDP-N-acetylmuramoyl-L-alanyl-D-glutamate--2,6-diaminopimelate ligase n=1 Tax=Natronospira proteinivora TaxID=1807133 RepID=A0ABT1G483_9GAMM|nr:UDP-N-acetylmuramoyl-L-alanyl-D-glutamate--2,6-diaminopimelate ligase [Natronospira proteinivora]MCP1726101.1 UDP-N-acetylmuramoyl-L-alanyl-D-glutamate--2,6-diaminopimelate ligase [Natronospira proteinivora]